MSEPRDGYTAVFWRHHSRYEEDGFETIEAATSFLRYGEDDGSLSSEAILDPNGVVVAERPWNYSTMTLSEPRASR